MTTFLWIILPLAISGYCFIAYNHPAKFKTFATLVSKVLFNAVFGWIFIYIIADTYLDFAKGNISQESIKILKENYSELFVSVLKRPLQVSLIFWILTAFFWLFVAKLKEEIGKEPEPKRAGNTEN